MKAIIPITILLGSSVLSACGGSATIGGDTSDNVTGGVDAELAEIVFTQTTENTRNDPEEWFEEAEILALTGQGEMVYLEQIGALLTHYIDITKDSAYPAGLNYEITNALLGQNSKKIAVIDANHPKINQEGEIVDGWGTPYYFHSETSEDITIQSAGPDLLQYTEDDIVYAALNQLAETSPVDTVDTVDPADDNGLSIGAALSDTDEATRKSTFDGYETGEQLPQ